MMKKLSLSLLAIAAVSALVMGGTFALFTATASNVGNTFTAGTVTLGTTSTAQLNFANLAPGDSGTQNYTLSYTGSLDAFLGVNIDITNDMLLTCDGANSMQLTVNGTQYSADAVNVLVMNGLSKTFANGNTASIVVGYNFPAAAGNACQGDSADVTLTVHAVQARNNTDAVTGNPVAWN